MRRRARPQPPGGSQDALSKCCSNPQTGRSAIMDARTNASVSRTCTAALFGATMGLTVISPGVAENLCRPSLTLSEVQFSAIRTPKLQRTWTAIVTADTLDCAVNSGGFFDIVFTRLSETAPDLEFRQRFAWSPFAANVAIDFAADEAVAAYRIENVTPCVCRDRAAQDRAGARNDWRKQ